MPGSKSVPASNGYRVVWTTSEEQRLPKYIESHLTSILDIVHQFTLLQPNYPTHLAAFAASRVLNALPITPANSS